MKYYIRNSESLNESLQLYDIVSLVFTNDIEHYEPRNQEIHASDDIDYSTLTKDELLQLDKKELENISDIKILRKLDYSDLTLQQKRQVAQANKHESQDIKIKDVKNALNKLKNCNEVYRWMTPKNRDFSNQISEMGGRIREDDVLNIVRNLHVKDFSEGRLSYLEENWNSLLLIFEYSEPYTFPPKVPDGSPVTVDPLDIYIKIDIDNETHQGYAVMSFHSPEGKMNHPYKNYPIDKE